MATRPDVPDLLHHLVEIVARDPTLEDFFQAALPSAAHTLSAEFLAVAHGLKGVWRLLGQYGKSEKLPTEFLADVLDSDQTLVDGRWGAAPLGPDLPGQLLIGVAGEFDRAKLEYAASSIGSCIQIVRELNDAKRRGQRLSAMLDMTVRWNQTSETGELLQTMAETSTQLLGAERATIFLLDQGGGDLIGRPALGVAGGELRIPRDTGVVGQVIRTGLPQRVDEGIATEQAQIDRAVDRKLGFETRSLLCVPMNNAAGQIIGAFELINKRSGTFSESDQEALAELAAHAAVAIENTQHIEKLKTAQRHVADEAADKVRLIGQSPAMVNLKNSIERIAKSELAVLVLGENGTGKEVVAQLIHYLSPRRDNVLVAVNCAAITETLLESELFGHEKGAFTDAYAARPGKFELANGGTLFLDEIGDMSLSGQAKLLRVLEEKIVVRVGGSQPITTDVRVVAATNQNLGERVREKKFREDLFFRLNVVTLELPPLRDRGSDVIELAEHFLQDFCAKARRPTPTFTAAARKRLIGHSWPGNVRELRNMMERLAYLFSGDRVDADDLSFVMSPGQSPDAIPMDLPLSDATRHFQAEYIRRHIKRSGGNMTDAAGRLGMHRSNLYRKMKQLGMDEDDSGAAPADGDD